MTRAWQEYQGKAARLFRTLGLDATVDHRLEGARGTHDVDVFVEGSYLGIRFRWVVECKAWKSNVPKEKVMLLASISQDVGADRAFLLSEKGFQSGAIRAASKSNITLTSLSDLSLATGEHLTDATIGNLQWRLVKARNRLRAIKKKHYEHTYWPPTMEPLTKLGILEFALTDAFEGVYPTIYLMEGDKRIEAADFEQMVRAADVIISEAENWTPHGQTESHSR